MSNTKEIPRHMMHTDDAGRLAVTKYNVNGLNRPDGPMDTKNFAKQADAVKWAKRFPHCWVRKAGSREVIFQKTFGEVVIK